MVLELVRRKDLYVLILLMMVFCVGAVGARVAGVDDAASGTFLLNLGMTLAYAFSHVLTLLLGARQVPDELEKRTIYPLLARPVSRGEYLIGKWAAGVLCGVACYLLFLLLVWLSAPHLETYDAMLLLQTVVLVSVSLALTVALAMLLSLLLPKAMSIVVLGAYLAAAAMLFSVLSSIVQGSAAESAVGWGYAVSSGRFEVEPDHALYRRHSCTFRGAVSGPGGIWRALHLAQSVGW